MYTQCFNCLSEIFFPDGKDQVRCPACTRINDRPKTQGETMNRMKRANELCADGEFEAAASLYHRVLEENLDEHEARWGLLLCKYGVIYERDNGGRRYPTCRVDRASAFCSEPEFQRACELASPEVRAQYEADGRYIDAIQSEIRRLEDEEPPYDVFICYKETAPDGGRTVDSVLAQDLYAELTRLNYRVFYAPETLTGLLGADYEAAIYHAVSTAQVMLVVGTCPEYFESTWVRSEWRRFLAQIDSGARKRLVALYRGMPAEKLPRDFLNRRLQSVNMDRLGALLDVDSFLQRFIRKEKPTPPAAEPKPEEPVAQPVPAAENPPESPMDALKRRAESGDADAAMELGRRHETGDGVEQSAARAGYWYAQALVQGRTEAMAAIARLSGGQPIAPEKKAVAAEKQPEKQPHISNEQVFTPSERQANSGDAGAMAELSAPKRDVKAMYRRARTLWNTGTEEEVRAVVGDIEALARQNDREAQYWLAKCCQIGMGVEKNFKAEAEWLRKSAEQGFADAQFSLGMCYQAGRGVDKDAETAGKWFRKAAEQYRPAADAGQAWGQTRLADCYADGRGVEKDAARACELYRAAAEQGDPEAQYHLFAHLYFGLGVQKHPEPALDWLRKSAEQEYPEAEERMAMEVMVGSNWSDWPEVFRWWERAFEHGGDGAASQLAILYENGSGVEKNPAEAFRLFMLDAKHGKTYSYGEVGRCYLQGVGVSKNTVEAVKWYRRAAEAGKNDARLELGKLYESGTGVKKDPAEAYRLYAQAGEENEQAAFEAGRCCEQGIGTQKDEAAALQWYEKAGSRGDSAKRELQKRLAQKNATPEPKLAAPAKPQPAESAPGKERKSEFDMLFEASLSELKNGNSPQSAGRERSDEINRTLDEILLETYASDSPAPRSNPLDGQYSRVVTSGSDSERVALARRYIDGGEWSDFDRALELLKPLEFSNNAQARYLMGVLYLNGTSSFRPSAETAVRFFEIAAKLGSDEAALQLGAMYMSGTFVEKDTDKAKSWYERAAYAGSAKAQYELGNWYFAQTLGSDFKTVNTMCVRWYREAAKQHNGEAEAMLAYLLENRLWEDPSLDCRALYARAAEHGSDRGQYWMGKQCEKEHRDDEAERWYRKAADQNNVLAQYSLGALCERKKRDSEAATWYEKAAKCNSRDAMYALAMLKYEGRGTAKDRSGALELLQQAKTKGHKEAAKFLQKHLKFGRLW